MVLQSINPATEKVMDRFEPQDAQTILAALDLADQAFRRHRKTRLNDRAGKMLAVAEILESEKAEWARIMTEEMGKPLAAAIAEAEKCAWACRFYAENAEPMLADHEIQMDAKMSFVRHLPLGPILAVMPWNFPFWQVIRFAAPNLMAGNVALLKHASNVPRCALALEEIFMRAGFDAGVFQTLLIGSDQVDAILKDSRVRAATLTGSEGAGRSVAKTAGGEIKKTVLELGGSDPFIVMPSADLENAIETAVTARMINNGQSCIAAKRFIVHEDVYDTFREGFVERVKALNVGDPMDEETAVGPLATAEIRDDLASQIRESVASGARMLAGGITLDQGPGWFFLPGVFEDVPDSAPAYREELFGPVAALFRVAGLDAAIEIANATPFGLGSAIWSRDEGEIQQAIDKIEAGSTFVNAMVASDPRLPFGGVKNSGYGRELAHAGMLEFVNQKTVSIQ